MGRHSGGEKRRRSPLVFLGLVVVAALVGVGGAAWSTGYLGNLFDPGDPCATRDTLVVIADPSIAPAISAVTTDFEASRDFCVEADVVVQESADTAALLASGGEPDADVWVPDSTVWVDRMAATAASLGRPAPEVVAGSTIATSPVVFAAPAARAAEFGPDPLAWTAVFAASVDTLLPDPESTSASLAALLAMRSSPAASDPRQFAGTMIELGKRIPASVETAFDEAFAAQDPTIVVASEQAVAAFNGADPEAPLVAIYPADGTTALAYPFARLGSPSDDDDRAPAGLVDELESALLDLDDELRASGLRDGAGAGELDVPGIVVQPAVAAPAIDTAAQIEILRSWGVLTLRSRILSVIDVSGSMLEPAEGGLRRIDIFQQAAVGALGKFSGEVELGVWVFSTDRSGSQDWEDLSPIEPLADQAHLSQITEIIASLPGRISGDTGLYDTTLAAVQRVREAYDPGKVNSVLLITDGKNDDDDGIELDALLAELERIDDPLRPVPVIMIGFGPDTDVEAMRRIALATGGAAYSASKPADLGLVLVDALSQRTCRPNC